MHFSTHAIGVGAIEITDLDCAEPLDDGTFSSLHRLFLEYPVMVFRGQSLSAPALAAFARHFGTLETYESPSTGSRPATAALRQTNARLTPDQMLYPCPDEPDVLLMANKVHEDIMPIAIVDNAETWHADGSHKLLPYRAIALHVIQNPAAGGDTEYCDLRAIYEVLPPKIRKALLNHYAFHHWSKSQNPRFAAVLDPAAREEGDRIAATIPEVAQPIICAHPQTGKPHLYLSPRFTLRIDGVTQQLSENILEDFFSLMDEKRFIYRHIWREKDLVIWDNHCINHRVQPFAAHDLRSRYRVTVSGKQPLLAFKPVDDGS